MVFSDLFFLFAFIPSFALCYLIAAAYDRHQISNPEHPLSNTHHARNLAIVLFSLIFYAWGEPVYVFLMFGCVLINYIAGLLIDRQKKQGWRKLALTAGLVCNILILGTFKYLGFFVDQLAQIGIVVNAPKLSLPIGISFYTFQSISYLIDVFRRQSPVQRRFVDLLLYISMFPQLIAGPIVRYDTVARQIHDRHVSMEDLSAGVYRFLIGLGKKVILANQLSEISDQFLVNGLSSLSTAGAWIGIIAYTFQIYFDFSGYSDMAIGLGRCMGFHFNENFRHPYCCNSITDFWRRWHISLGSFFRDYVYIPLGGNRRHQALNIFIVWFLTGMWHGASWNFIIWGVYFGFIVTIEKYTLLKLQRHPSTITRILSPITHIYSMLLVVIGWGIFYFDDFQKMRVFFRSFFAQKGELTDFVAQSALTDHFWLWIVAIVFCMPIRSTVAQLFNRFGSQSSILSSVSSFITFVSRLAVSIVILALSVALLVGATNNAFIYTRF